MGMEEENRHAKPTVNNLIQECSVDKDCRDGQVCKSNGCGHTCTWCVKTGAPCRCLCMKGYKTDEYGKTHRYINI